MHWRIYLFAAGLVALAASTLAQAFPMQPEVRQFIDRMVEKHDFDEQMLVDLFEQARFRQDIIDAISRPAEAKPWYQYRPIFVTDARARGGVEFWSANRNTLKRAEERFGVPAEIIVAIIGVETRYGAHTGRYRVIDSLTTLGFGYPPRSRFFLSELEQFLLMSREEQMDPIKVKGSYAGALGKAQFISSSFREYAIDFDGDGKRDLWNSNEDAIGSVANYFVRHGWKQGQTVATRASGVTESTRHLVTKGRKPHVQLHELYQAGISTDPEFDDSEVSFIALENRDGEEHWIGFHNFYVITRYNHSNLYAMAVYQLSREILALMQERELDPLIF
jgi:membrane-bound lytic murein transglycosylase B